ILRLEGNVELWKRVTHGLLGLIGLSFGGTEGPSLDPKPTYQDPGTWTAASTGAEQLQQQDVGLGAVLIHAVQLT
ncbi:hypothetical protein P7K49_027610, partial [Saguinus oedipus]